MKSLDIRARVLLAALLPATLLAFLLALVFLLGRMDDLGEAHDKRMRSLVRQVSSASEYGIFSGDNDNLLALAEGVLREPDTDIRSVRILNARGELLAQAGEARYKTFQEMGTQEAVRRDDQSKFDLWVQPVMAAQIKLDDLFSANAPAEAQASRLLGHVLMEVSRDAVLSKGRDMLLTGLLVTAGGLLFAILLALRISQGVIRPIMRVSYMVDLIRRGNLAARGEIMPDDPLRDLQAGLNQMAEHLERGRDELEQRVIQATTELRQKKEEAERATQAKSRFLAAASHDLRQPTHAMGLLMAQLKQHPQDGGARELVAHLDESVAVLRSMLDTLLDISRLDASAVQAQRRSFPVQSLLTQLYGNLVSVAREKGLELRVRPSPSWVNSDPALLQRIIFNLTDNAIRYTGHGGVLVACRMARGGRSVRIEVWDTGIGIAPEHQRDIFKEFFQVGNAERDRNKGLGLGLNIVERTADLLGHPLKLCSRPGRGTRFSLEVPVSRSGHQGLQAIPLSSGVGDGVDGLQVLIVEDDALVAMALRGLLESWGVVVSAASDAQEALHCLAQAPRPDLIISDYRLRAGVTGMDVIRQLREAAEKPIPACLMSGDLGPELAGQIQQEQGVVLLGKPVQVDELRRMLVRLTQDEWQPT